MTRWFERLAKRYLGISGLAFTPGPLASGRILFASLIPAIAIGVLLIDLAIDVRFDLYGGGTLPEAWEHVSFVTSSLQSYITTLGVAVLFLLGLRKWERWEGSWMFLIGAVLVACAILSGIAAFAFSLFFTAEGAIELRSFTWSGWAARLGYLAIGYLFVAHQALARPAPVVVRRYRRRRPPGRPAAHSTEP